MISKEILLAKLNLHNHSVAAVMAVSLVLVIFIGSFLSGSMAFSTAFVYSTTTTAATATSSINKEIPVQFKDFILNPDLSYRQARKDGKII